MPDTDLLPRIVALADTTFRPQAARALARYLGGDDALVFARDDEAGVLLPAPGFPQTLVQGRRWWAFLESCLARGWHTDSLPYGDKATFCPVLGVASGDEAVVAVVGGCPSREAVEDIRQFLPLLAAIFRAERAAEEAAGCARLATENAMRAKSLAERLDVARREMQRALNEAESARQQSITLARARDAALAETEAERARLKSLYEALRESESLKGAILETALDCIITMDHTGTIVEFNPAAERTFGYSRLEAIGQELASLIVPPRLREAHRHGLARYVETSQARMLGTRIEIAGMRANGEEFPIEMAITRIPTGGPPLFTGYLRDISDRKQAEATLAHQALHDALTDLPNRTLLHRRVEQALHRADLDDQRLALLLLDLDHFKDVNDAFGHHHGDLLLQQVACRLTAAVRHSDTVARLGGDEFAVILPGSGAEGALLVADAIRDSLDQLFEVEGRAVRVGASIGAAIYPEHGRDAETLLRHADIAMYVAKRTRGGPSLYAPSQDGSSPGRLTLIAELGQALDEEALTLHYQPMATLRAGTRRRRGAGEYPAPGQWFEALVRWPHPRRGLVSPDEFVPLAEQAGLITRLTRLVLEMSARQCAEWRRLSPHVGVAVNISVLDIHDPHFPRYVTDLLRRCGLPPSCLQLELTEGVLIADAPLTLQVLEGLAATGVRLSVDDFGTGYSSLSYLKRLPVHVLKIDRSFVRNMATDDADASIVRSTISLGHALGLAVVGEGVEDERTWSLLNNMECDQAQGYFISRPLPAEQVRPWLLARPSLSSA
ncbi:MAG: EAL domain-containing protein [Chloroflexi bacterium]|nr:EAL domain-containing protein [Chloroflexota bacterium]